MFLLLAPIAAGLAGWGAHTAWRPVRTPEISELDWLTGPAAYDRGVDSARAGQVIGSLPYFRRAVALEPAAMQVHLDFGRALFATGYERRADSESPLRSSVERVGLMREALREMEIAQRLPAAEPDRAEALGTTGEMLMLWGFPWEGFWMYRRAEDAEPASRMRALRARAATMVLREPDRYAPGGLLVPVEESAKR